MFEIVFILDVSIDDKFRVVKPLQEANIYDALVTSEKSTNDRLSIAVRQPNTSELLVLENIRDESALALIRPAPLPTTISSVPMR